MVAVIDYDAGNIGSVSKALINLGENCVLTANENEILKADHIILPGVGSFGDAMNKLNERNLEPVIKKAVESGIPFMGICLGLQLLFDESEASPGVPGLSVLKGKIKKIPGKDGLKIPHMGWNSLSLDNDTRLFSDLSDEPYVYFVHSYYLEADDESAVSARTEYGVKIDAAVTKNNVFACQFHPEKSGETGLKILKNFLKVK